MLKGEVHLIIRDSETGEVKREHKQQNVITNSTLSVLRDGWIRYSAADAGKVLTISRYNVLLHE